MRRSLWLLGVAVLVSCDAGRDRLLTDLQSGRPELRALAVRKLGEQRRLDDLILFTRAARDPSAVVREEAAVALGASGAPEVEDLLTELVEDPDEGVQTRAITALARQSGEKPRAFLILRYGRTGRAARESLRRQLEDNGLKDAPRRLVESEAKILWDRHVRALKQGAVAERVTAAELLGQSGRADAVDALLPVLQDRQVTLAAAAARGLGAAGERRAVPALLTLLGDTYPELREATLEALGSLRPTEAAPALAAIAKESSPASVLAVRDLVLLPRSPDTDRALCGLAFESDGPPSLTAATAMRGRGGCPPALITAALSARAARGHLPSVLRAVAALGHTALPSAPELARYMAAREPEIAELAVRAVGATGDQSQATTVLALYQAEWNRVSAARADWVKVPLPAEPAPGFDPRPRSVRAAETVMKDGAPDSRFNDLMQKVDALDATRRRQPTPVAPEVVPEEADASLRFLGATLLAWASLAGPPALTIVRDRIRDPASAVREAALLAAPRLGQPGVALAVSELPATRGDFREALARALCEAGDAGKEGIVKALLSTSGDGSLPLLKALQESGAPTSAVGLLEALLRRGGAESVLAARILGALRTRSSVPALLEVLRDNESPARRDALWALGQIGDPSVAAAVAGDLFHESPDVRAAAVQAVGLLGVLADRPMVEALTHDYYRAVREAAQTALAAGAGPAGGAGR